jgi:vacuolar-type H+-ATPase subunit E/Vma4
VLTIKKGLVAIASEILEDLESEAKKVIRDAEKEAEEILRKAKEEAEKARARLLTEAKEKGEIEKRKIKSSTEMEMRNKFLQVKEELVNATFDKTLSRLNDFAQTESYHSYLLKLISEAAEKIDSDTLVVYVNSKDREWLSHGRLDNLSEKLRVKIMLADETEKCVGGCIVKASDGKTSYDNTFENRLKLLKPVLRTKIAKILFGKGG